ncbi:MAG: histidine phosphatase family protein [Planctomycetes bacterium]|nr:histidine phosphatase family protein [Planctomycetota bacterium]
MLADVTDFCRLILFRHPELAAEDAGRVVGDGPATLGHRGQAQTIEWMKLLADLPVDRVVSSDQPQSRDAAAAIAVGKGLEVEADDRLRDQYMGRWQGRTWDEVTAEDPDRVREFFTDFGEVAAPDGESLGAAVERFLGWWTDVRSAAVGKTIAVVSSGAMVTGFATAMLGMRLSRAVCLNLPHGGLGVLDVFANGARVACWNPGAIRVPS